MASSSPQAIKEVAEKGMMGDHPLLTFETGGSSVEHLVEGLEKIRETRFPIMTSVRFACLKKCKEIAEKKKESGCKIPYDDLLELRDEYKKIAESRSENKKQFFMLGEKLGIINFDDNMTFILDEAVKFVDDIPGEDKDKYFYFFDFNFYHTVLQHQITWLRHPFVKSIFYTALFYFITPVLFCHVIQDPAVCPRNRLALRFVDGLYFASVTLSTVGYGDLTVTKVNNWSYVLGTAYMLFATLFLILVFSTVMDGLMGRASLTPWMDDKIRKFVDLYYGAPKATEDMRTYAGRVKAVTIVDVLTKFILVNLVGVLAARIAIANSKNFDPDSQSWMATVYWAVQTTTTIGYGDVPMPYENEFFGILYLILSTGIIASTLGNIGSLKTDLLQKKREFAWKRRQLSRSFLTDIQGGDATFDDDGDLTNNKVDQYQFVLASLVNLGKVTSEDVAPIMDKFRELVKQSGSSHYIHLDQETEDNYEYGHQAMFTADDITHQSFIATQIIGE